MYLPNRRPALHLMVLLSLAPLLTAALSSDRGRPLQSSQQLAGAPDLVARISLVQNKALPDASHSVRVAIENAGASFQSSIVNRVRLSTDSVCDFNDDLLVSLYSDGMAAGSRIEFVRNVATPHASSTTAVQLCWQVDEQDELIETVESNNLDQTTLLLVPGLMMTDGFESGDDSYWDALAS